MKTYIFIPDTDKNAGLGHLFRCLKYSNFIKKPHKIIFLINKDFNKSFLIDKNLNKRKINFIFFTNLKKTLHNLKFSNKNVISFLDSYNRSLQNFSFKDFSKKHINILDFKMKFKSDYAIDHTFKRKITYYTNSDKIAVGIKNFPIFKKLSILKRDFILINFGSVNDKLLIHKSLNFLEKIKLDKIFKIIIISKNASRKNFLNIELKNKIIFHKFVKDIDKIYQRTFFSFGACGISLYDRCYYNIPSICKCLAKNQDFNFKNFLSNGCILDFDRVIKLKVNESDEKRFFFKNILKIKKNIYKNFNYKKNKKHLTAFFKKINDN